MKKYLQYNAAQFAASQVEVGPITNPVNNEKPKDDSRGVILDLSGKHGLVPVPLATGQKWGQEQDSALDLSNCSLQKVGESQAEALDLSKPSQSRSDINRTVSFCPASTGMHQSGHTSAGMYQSGNSSAGMHQSGNTSDGMYQSGNTSAGMHQLGHILSKTPPTSAVTRPSTGQYSLLQAALNSSQTNTPVHSSFPDTSCLDSRARMIAALAALEVSRSIKPFASGGPHRFGMPIPPMSYTNPPVTVIQGIHKPIAITAPQPHVSNAESKSQTSCHTTISVSGSSQLNHEEKDGRKLHYTSSIRKHGPPSDKQLLQESYQRDVERYVLQTQNCADINNGTKALPLPNTGGGFSCMQCGKSYKTKAALKLHATVHKTSEERQYECSMCKRRFLHRHHLVVHQRKHSGEKPFKCDACGKTFMAIFLLHKHLRKHVRESGPNCQISSEQLTKLNLKRDTIDVSGIEKIPYPKSRLDTRQDQGPKKARLDVLPLTTGENLAKFHETNLALLNKKGDMNKDSKAKYSGVEVIDLSSDDLTSSHGSGITHTFNKKSSFHSDASEIQGFDTQESWGNVNRDDSNLELDKHSSAMVGGYSAQKGFMEKFTDVNERTNELLLDSKTEETDTSDETEDQSVCANPFPSYSSSDEVELDFETGELKILSKNTETTAKSEVHLQVTSDNDSLKIVDENIENKVRSSNISANQIEVKDFDTGDNKDTQSLPIKVDLSKDSDNSTEIELNGNNHHIKHKKSVELISGPQTMSSRLDRNVLEDVNENAYKDVNMNEPNTCFENLAANMHKAKMDENNASNPVLDSQIQTNTATGSALEKSVEDEVSHVERTPIQHHGSVMLKKKAKRKGKRHKRVKCEVCSRTFHSDHHLILHMSVHKKNQMLQSLKKAKAQQMKSMGYQQQKVNVICKICKKTFKFQKSLNSHMRIHSDKMAKQKLLSKAFRDFMAEAVASSRTAERTSSSESSALSKTSDLSETCHLQSVDLGVKDKLINSFIESRTDCIEYMAQYSKNDRLEDPPIKVIIGKDNIKRFLCHACDNTYTTKQKLRMHALIHKDNCFLCDICGKSFFRLLTLEKHIATHKLPRPHVCMFCKKSFIHRSSLMRHRVIHEKPNTPTIKQQAADISFELKMLDTYTMLRQERLEKIQKTKLNELFVDPTNSMHQLENEGGIAEKKGDILDLSVRIKTDDVSLPPVLSPANTPNNIQMNAVHLSPPVITGETCQDRPYQKQEPEMVTIQQELAKDDAKHNPSNIVKEEPNDMDTEYPVENKMECHSISKSCESRKKRNSDELFGTKDHVTDTFHKKSRKTRVYQTSCRVCKEQFPNVMTLKSHMSVHNMVETHLYECSVCHHRFTQSCSLLRHLKTSCQVNRLNCLPCGKTFNLKHSYDEHMKLHNGLPPNLDGSFYDKRKDEVEGIQVKEEKEIEIETNNNMTTVMMSQIPAKMEQQMKMESFEPKQIVLQTSPLRMDQGIHDYMPQDLSTKPGPSGEINYDSDDSDAKTYLYSEGECRLKDMSDFSDTEELSTKQDLNESDQRPQSKQDLNESEQRPQSVESHSSSGVMTLNLLSAVCSDIRNAEKEEETRRKEMEERQKELETIEILANLKRGRMQQNNLSHSTSMQETQSNTISDRSMVGSGFDANEIHSVIQNQVLMAGKQIPSVDENVAKPKTTKHINTSQHQSIRNEPRNMLNIPQIPTVVFEIAAEAERLRQAKLANQTDSRLSTLPNKDGGKGTDLNPHAQFLHSLAQMTLHDRLALLMKGPIPPLSSIAASMSSPRLSSTLSNKPATPNQAYNVTRSHADLKGSSSSPVEKVNSKTPPQITPQDLSVKRHHLGVTNLSLPLSTSSPNVPGTRPVNVMEPGSRMMPTVPPFHCELCGQFIYNQIEYQQHLQEHLHNIQQKGQSLMNHHGNAGQQLWVLDRAKTLGVSSSQNSRQREWTVKAAPKAETITPPSTLDLTSKRPYAGASGQDVSSPLTGSDFSNDTVLSPSTPSSSSSALNLDVLRKELRNKIYARRRSQGLEELKVEFKPPEMTEMTEEELVKLDFRRECNRQAAQRSRMRKKDLVDSLIEELHQEEIVHSDLRHKLESLTTEKNYLLKTLQKHSCVQDKA